VFALAMSVKPVRTARATSADTVVFMIILLHL
jgi:hypothetical protein